MTSIQRNLFGSVKQSPGNEVDWLRAHDGHVRFGEWQMGPLGVTVARAHILDRPRNDCARWLTDELTITCNLPGVVPSTMGQLATNPPERMIALIGDVISAIHAVPRYREIAMTADDSWNGLVAVAVAYHTRSEIVINGGVDFLVSKIAMDYGVLVT